MQDKAVDDETLVDQESAVARKPEQAANTKKTNLVESEEAGMADQVVVASIVPCTSAESLESGEEVSSSPNGVGVTIKTPIDSVMSPAKMSRTDFGPAIPSSLEALYGSSPELPHKDASCSSQLFVEKSVKMGVEFSQSPWGSSVSPQGDSVSQQDSSLEENIDN